MNGSHKRKNFETKGWILFACGSLVFLLDSILNQNILGTVASASFVVGCGFFIIAEKYK